jgi:hypothetical protein
MAVPLDVCYFGPNWLVEGQGGGRLTVVTTEHKDVVLATGRIPERPRGAQVRDHVVPIQPRVSCAPSRLAGLLERLPSPLEAEEPARRRPCQTKTAHTPSHTLIHTHTHTHTHSLTHTHSHTAWPREDTYTDGGSFFDMTLHFSHTHIHTCTDASAVLSDACAQAHAKEKRCGLRRESSVVRISERIRKKEQGAHVGTKKKSALLGSSVRWSDASSRSHTNSSAGPTYPSPGHSDGCAALSPLRVVRCHSVQPLVPP